MYTKLPKRHTSFWRVSSTPNRSRLFRPLLSKKYSVLTALLFIEPWTEKHVRGLPSKYFAGVIVDPCLYFRNLLCRHLGEICSIWEVPANQLISVFITTTLITPVSMAIVDMSPRLAFAKRGLFHSLKVGKLRAIVHGDLLKNLRKLFCPHAALQRVQCTDNAAGCTITHTHNYFLARASLS